MTSTSLPRRSRAPRGEGERLRGDIVEATSRLLARMGSDEALSLRAVAREVGVSAPSVYLHFPDKEAVLLAVAAELFGDLQRTLDAAAAHAGDDPVASLLARARAYVTWGLEHPGHYKVLYEGALLRRIADPPQPVFGRALLLALVADLQRAVAAGALPPSDDPERRARLLWQAAHGVVSLRINKPGVAWDDPERDVEALIRAVLRLPP
ncbi:MAG: TetR/AcrR family transcriptional regulator [Actinomycetota bacterium]|nr:TetR/AcrR family transcriptional regulator [Actinomycetota bacterium]